MAGHGRCSHCGPVKPKIRGSILRQKLALQLHKYICMKSSDLLRINSILVERESEGRVECWQGKESLSLEVTLAQNSEVSATSPAMTNHLQMSVKGESNTEIRN